MLKLSRHQCFDLNILGLIFVFCLFVFVLIYLLPVEIILGLELLLAVMAAFLLKQVQVNKNASVLLNNESQWYIESDGKTSAVQLKDYWIFSELIFFWLKGEKYSVSFVVSRSIIGAKKFSQLRAKII